MMPIKVRDEKFKSEEKARDAVKVAIAAGRLIRPDTCQRCKRNPGRGKDGRALIQAHHHDYSKPLEVEWLCTKCHRDDTPLPPTVGDPVRGERNVNAKLTTEKVIQIRRMFAGGMRKIDIAKCFGVSDTAVADVISGKRWGHIPKEGGAVGAGGQNG